MREFAAAFPTRAAPRRAASPRRDACARRRTCVAYRLLEPALPWRHSLSGVQRAGWVLPFRPKTPSEHRQQWRNPVLVPVTEMARYRRQCLAIGSRNVRRAAKHSRPYGSLWRRRQEEVGDQLGIHVDLRIRLGARRLGPVRLQHGIRTAMVPVPRHADARAVGRVQYRPGDHPRRRVGHAAQSRSRWQRWSTSSSCSRRSR